MSDISMCSGKSCKLKDECHRHTANVNKYRQSYFSKPPLKEDGSCEYFWENK